MPDARLQRTREVYDQPRRVLHPALVAHGAKVKAAHAALDSATFRAQPAKTRMKQIQAHIRRRS